MPLFKLIRCDSARLQNKTIGLDVVVSDPLNLKKDLVLFFENKEFHAVVKLATKLCAKNPDDPDVWNLLGAAQTKLCDFNNAKIAFQQVIRLSSLNADAHFNLGKVLALNNQLDEAINVYKKAVKIQPKHFRSWYNLALALRDKGDLRNATRALYKTIKLQPDLPETYNNLGSLLGELHQPVKSIQAFKQAISLRPTYAEAFYNLGNALKEQGKLEEAIASYKKALSLKPDYADAYYNMGINLQDQGKIEEAIAAYKKALSLKPDYADAYNNMGVTLKDQGQLDEAVEAYNKALAIKPDYAEAYNNMGTTFQDQGKLEEAIASHNKALAIKHDYADAHHNLSFALLNSGRVKEGLDEYEWRWNRAEGLSNNRHFSKPKWDGNRNVSNKTILLWSEQGPGDVVMWLSVLKFLTPLVKHCIIECPKKLQTLFERSFPNVEVQVENRETDLEKNNFDFHLPVGSLFRHFLPEITKHKDVNAYLIPDQLRVAYWKKRLSALSAGPFIGISWKSPVITRQRLRNYTTVNDWEQVLSIPDITFINLQAKDFEHDITQIKEKFGVKVYNFDEIDHYDDLDEVAALSAALDMCVSVSTTISTITAAVGTPTKMLHWRQSSWNNILFTPKGPSVDIFERNTGKTWDKAFENIAKDVNTLGKTSKKS